MHKSTIIFDLDGTLINTVQDLNEAVNYALSLYGFESRSLEQTTKDIGSGVAKLIERSIPNGRDNPLYDDCLANFKSYYRKHYIDHSFPYPEIKELLTTLKDKGYKLAVVSNKFHEGVEGLMNHYFKDVFDVVQGEDKSYPTKPNPKMMNHVIDFLKVDKKDCLYIGDTEVDFESATNAGIDIVLVSYGYRNMAFLHEKLKNVPIIETPLQLLNILVD